MGLSVLTACVSICARILQFLSRCHVFLQEVLSNDPDECQIIAQVAADLAAQIEIQMVKASTEMLSHIACHHRYMETYREHQLCSNRTEQTFLIDLKTHAFVKATTTHLIRIGSRNQAKAFVDQIWSSRQERQ